MTAVGWTCRACRSTLDEPERFCGYDRGCPRKFVLTSAQPPAQPGREEETFSSIIQWGDDTFGHGEPQRIIERAWEEWKEMIAPGADMAIEAADVIIVLLRLPGIAEAIQRKMAINRGREWRLLGDGTGYHVPALSTEPLLARQDWPKELDASASMSMDFERRYDASPAQDVRPEAEPVAWIYEIQGTGVYRLYRTRYVSPQQAVEGWIETPLYAHPATSPTEPAGLREALEDIVSHRRAWRSALITARDFACEGSEDPQADRSYWNHELRAFDRTFAALSTLPTEPASVREERLDADLVRAFKSALRFAASRSVITSAQEQGIIAALSTEEPANG